MGDQDGERSVSHAVEITSGAARVTRSCSSAEAGEEDPDLKDLPPQLLFIHQGLKDVKEIHWHSKIPGLLMATSHTGFDVFRTISV